MRSLLISRFFMRLSDFLRNLAAFSLVYTCTSAFIAATFFRVFLHPFVPFSFGFLRVFTCFLCRLLADLTAALLAFCGVSIFMQAVTSTTLNADMMRKKKKSIYTPTTTIAVI